MYPFLVCSINNNMSKHNQGRHILRKDGISTPCRHPRPNYFTFLHNLLEYIHRRRLLHHQIHRSRLLRLQILRRHLLRCQIRRRRLLRRRTHRRSPLRHRILRSNLRQRRLLRSKIRHHRVLRNYNYLSHHLSALRMKHHLLR